MDFEVLDTNWYPQSLFYVTSGNLSFKFLTQALLYKEGPFLTRRRLHVTLSCTQMIKSPSKIVQITRLMPMSQLLCSTECQFPVLSTVLHSIR